MGDTISEEAQLPMTTYVLALIRRVPGRPPITEEAAEAIQEGHLTHIRQMMATGDLVAAGPFADDTDLRGVLLFRTDSLARVQELTADDPALVQGRLFLEIHPWYGPAGLAFPSPAVGGPTAESLALREGSPGPRKTIQSGRGP